MNLRKTFNNAMSLKFGVWLVTLYYFHIERIPSDQFLAFTASFLFFREVAKASYRFRTNKYEDQGGD